MPGLEPKADLTPAGVVASSSRVNATANVKDKAHLDCSVSGATEYQDMTFKTQKYSPIIVMVVPSALVLSSGARSAETSVVWSSTDCLAVAPATSEQHVAVDVCGL